MRSRPSSAGQLDASDKLLQREFGVVDLRLPDKLYLRKRAPAGDPPPNGPAVET